MKRVFCDKESKAGIGKDLAEIIVAAGFCATKSEARRAIKQGGVKLADVRVTDPYARLAYSAEFLLVETEQI